MDLLGIRDRIEVLLVPLFNSFKDYHGIITSKRMCPMGDRSHSTRDAARLQAIVKLGFPRSMASVAAMKLDKKNPRDAWKGSARAECFCVRLR